jgi:catechol-2,3-dioxygenase
MKIKEVILYTNSLDGISDFYVDVLELAIIQENNEKISFKAGTSILTLIN